MPGRYTIAFILLFFVGMSGWQWFRHYGATLGEDGATKWLILYNGKRLGDAQTQVIKTPNGIFLMKQDVMLDGDLESFLGPLGAFAKLSGIKLNDFRGEIKTDMELTYLGTMRKMQLSFKARPRPNMAAPGSPEELRRREEEAKRPDVDSLNLLNLTVTATVKEMDQLTFAGTFSFAGMKLPIEDVNVRYRHKESFLSNAAPTDCLADLRLGQRWQTPVIDPTKLMVSALASSKTKEFASGAFNADELVKTKVSEVRVLDELKELVWDGAKVPCFVVQSNEKGSKMQLWVNASNYRVLKQVFESDRHLLEMIREPKKEE
ncbi:MAG TPA: hypothetical protein PKA06_00455 [Gemmatales bacterium]|nr:hypothetical protein [Gemmatales bacterium]